MHCRAVPGGTAKLAVPHTQGQRPPSSSFLSIILCVCSQELRQSMHRCPYIQNKDMCTDILFFMSLAVPSEKYVDMLSKCFFKRTERQFLARRVGVCMHAAHSGVPHSGPWPCFTLHLPAAIDTQGLGSCHPCKRHTLNLQLQVWAGPVQAGVGIDYLF